MKVRSLALLVVPLLIAGCDSYSANEQDVTSELFELHLSASFNDYPVVVELDGMEIFRGQVSNEIPSDGGPGVSPFDLAAVLSTQLPLGAHRLEIAVNGVAHDELRFETYDKLFIVVTYATETGELRFTLLDEMPLYG